MFDNLTNVIKNHVSEMFGTSHVKAQVLMWTTSVEDEIPALLFLSDGVSSFRSFEYLFHCNGSLLDRDMDIFSSSHDPSVSGFGSMWKPLEKGTATDQMKMCRWRA